MWLLARHSSFLGLNARPITAAQAGIVCVNCSRVGWDQGLASGPYMNSLMQNKHHSSHGISSQLLKVN